MEGIIFLETKFYTRNKEKYELGISDAFGTAQILKQKEPFYKEIFETWLDNEETLQTNLTLEYFYPLLQLNAIFEELKNINKKLEKLEELYSAKGSNSKEAITKPIIQETLPKLTAKTKAVERKKEKEGSSKKGNIIYALNPDSKEEKYFAILEEAKSFLGCSIKKITNHIESGEPINGFILTYVKKDEKKA